MYDLGRGPGCRTLGHGLVEHTHYADVITGPAKVREQRGAECSQPALGGRVRAEQRVRLGHNGPPYRPTGCSSSPRSGSARPAYRPDHLISAWTFLAAVSMRCATSSGWETIATCPDGTSMVVAPMRAAK